MHRLQELVYLHRRGDTASDVAETLQLDPKTERKYRRRIQAAGLLDGDPSALPELKALRDAVSSQAPSPAQERSTVANYAAFVDEKRRQGLGPTAIHELLTEEKRGYTGSLSAVKRLYKRLKDADGLRAEDVAIPVHSAPGLQAQVDFGYVGKLVDPTTGKRRKAWVFVMVLSHSRLMYAEVVFSQDVDTWLMLHRHAFDFFGGVPHVVVPDNLKAAVINAAFRSDEISEVNRSYRECARHYGFRIDPTPAYSPEKKGKVESAVKYVKGSFFSPRRETLTDLDDANRRLIDWVRGTANERTHGTTGRQPRLVYDQVERSAMLGLPDQPYVPILWHRGLVGKNCHITFHRRFYSVPWPLVGKDAWLRVHGNAVTIYVDDDRVADHRLDGDTPWSTKLEHLPEGRRDLALRDPETWFARARELGADVEDYAREVMASDEVVYPLRRLQSIILALEGLTAERAASVARHAARYGTYRPDAVRRIIADQHDLGAKPSAEWVDANWATNARFARQSGDWLRSREVDDGCA